MRFSEMRKKVDSQKKEEFYDVLSDLYLYYEKVKGAIILSEDLDKDRTYYVAPMNELRSALDHVFKSVNIASDDEQRDYQLKEAKEHMGRAGCDALELAAGNLLWKIYKIVEKFNSGVLSTVIPEYYEVFYVQLTEIQNSIREHRKNGKTDTTKTFEEYCVQIEKLVEIDKAITKKIPALNP